MSIKVQRKRTHLQVKDQIDRAVKVEEKSTVKHGKLSNVHRTVSRWQIITNVSVLKGTSV